MMMKRLMIVVLCLLLPMSALADRGYLIPDSSSRPLTETELWAWDYESLGYIFNEILARHGYCFIPGEKYDTYFRTRSWYTPNANPDNNAACYPYVSNLEWNNIDLVKDVREQMREANFFNPEGRSVWDAYDPSAPEERFDVLAGFERVYLQQEQELAVFTAPDFRSLRSANGRASVGTNGSIYAAGWENGWLLVMYQTSEGGVRVGYVYGGSIQGGLPALQELSLRYQRATVDGVCMLTDDPVSCSTVLTNLRPGTQVTWLTSFTSADGWEVWDYIETTVSGKTTRGFLPEGYLVGVEQGAQLPVPELLDTWSYQQATDLPAPVLLGE